jgi:hypothetical protein
MQPLLIYFAFCCSDICISFVKCLSAYCNTMVVNNLPRRDACVCVERYVPSYFCIQIFRYSWRSRLSARTEERGRAAFTDFCDSWSTLHVWLAGTQQRSLTQDHLQVSSIQPGQFVRKYQPQSCWVLRGARVTSVHKVWSCISFLFWYTIHFHVSRILHPACLWSVLPHELTLS